MMNRIADFEKVSYERFLADWQGAFPAEEAQLIRARYDAIRTPRRATVGSAGYDFFAPCDLVIAPGETVRVPTGIRAQMEEGWVLLIFPRSGLGFKYRLQLDNTVGVIDSDYYHADNEGHIFIKLTNDSRENRQLSLRAGEGFAQGVFVPFGLTHEDAAGDIRTGGLGSTTKT